MRIIKYVFLLLILVLFAGAVFIATQKGTYEVERSIIIKSPQQVVFNYLADYRNWEQWSPWHDALSVSKYPVNNLGVGSYFIWKSDKGDGMARTIYVRETDSIVQQITNGSNKFTYYWQLKDTIGGTKVTWKTKGELAFMDKVDATLQGGAATVIGNLSDHGLANIDSNLDYEINSYKVALKGIVQKPPVSFLHQTINSKIANHPRNMRIMLGRMREFVKENQIKTAGSPFVIYHTYDSTAGITKFSVCIPVAEELYFAPGSDISYDKIPGMSVVSTTVTGDHSHLKKGWQGAIRYIDSLKLVRSVKIAAIESFKTATDHAKQPSKWITEIFIPIESPIVKDSVPIIRRTPRYLPAAPRADSINPATN